jgi:hypothetical protein
MVSAGACVVGGKPLDTSSLSDDQSEFRTITDQLGGAGTGEHQFGKGKVYGNRTLSKALAILQVGPDFEYTKPQSDTTLLFVH